MKLSITQLPKMIQLRGILSRLIRPLLKTGLRLIKNILKPLAKSVLIPSGLTAAASATDVVIQKNRFGSGMTTLIISKEKMNDIIKMVKSLEESSLSIKGVNKTIKNEAKNRNICSLACY